MSICLLIMFITLQHFATLNHTSGLLSLFFHSQNAILPTLVTAEYVKPAHLWIPFFKPPTRGT